MTSIPLPSSRAIVGWGWQSEITRRQRRLRSPPHPRRALSSSPVADLESGASLPEVCDSERRFKFIDLFAGLGGFHVALEGLGGECVFAAEWVPTLQDLYEQNFNHRPVGDITQVDPVDVPDHDFLTAGFPCQPFSKAGEQLGFEHTEQGRLFFNVRDILAAKRPSFFILENVPNLKKHKGGASFKFMIEELERLGYSVSTHQLSPHHFGVPQIRERLYFVGSRTGLSAFTWPEATHSETSIKSVLDVQPSDARPLPPSVMRALTVWDDFLRRSPVELLIPSFPIWSMEFGATYPIDGPTPLRLVERNGSHALDEFRGAFGARLAGLPVDQQLALLPSHAKREGNEFPIWKRDFLRQNRDFYAKHRNWIDPWLPSVRPFASSFQKFEWNAKGEEKTVWKYVVQLRASGVRIKRPTTSPSLIAMTETQVPIIAWERRFMTPRECARLQSLDELRLPAQSSKAFKALGNAVNAKVVGTIAASLLRNQSDGNTTKAA